MKKLILFAVVLAVTMFVASTAEAGRRRCRTYAPAPVAVQPAPVATAQAQPGYRAFSYQPATGMVRTTRVRSAQPGYLNAGTKASGRY